MAAGVPLMPGTDRPEPAQLFGWEPRGACRDLPADTFFPPDGRNSKAREAWEDAARRVCVGAPPCPVRRECLATALYRREAYGLWGGLTVHERGRLAPRGRLSEEEALMVADRVLAREARHGR
jgi:WhiB family redox-sensing transcriptional regulator